MRWNSAKSKAKAAQSGPRGLVGRQHGASIVEFVVVLPALLILGLGSIQSALFYQAKTIVTYATFEAARTGATTHALKAPMLDQFGLRMAPVFGGDGSGSNAMAAIAKGKTEARNASITRIDIINPTREAFQDFGVLNPETGKLEIPNTHLRHRNANDIRPNSGVNIQDANLLKIKSIYGYHLKVPLINSIVTAALKKIDPQNAAFYDQNRIPISAVATVRMHSEAWEDGNLSATGAPPGGAVVPGGESSEGSTPAEDPNGDPTDGQGSDTGPLFGNGNTCDSTTTSCVAGGGNSFTNNPATQGNPNSCPKPGEDVASRQTANVTGLPATGTGNPIHVVSGNKYQLETDHPALPGPLGLVWQRHYNSQSNYRAELGAGWRHSYDVQARPAANGFRVIQADGRHILFTAAADGRYEGTLNSDGWLTQAVDSTYGDEERITWHWRNGQQLKFNARGQLSDITSPSGDSVRLQYNDDQRLFLVRDAQNRELSLSYYPNGRLKRVLDTTGQPLRYRYDDRGNLESVTYTDNTTRHYHYEDQHDPNNLTGITDQLGNRFVTWSYDEQDRAISSEHADGVEKVSINFNDDGTRLITNSLGEVSTYYTEQRNGFGIVTAIAGPGCSSCSMGDVQYEYDEQLNLVRSTDKVGKTTVSTYDGQGRITTLSLILPDAETRELVRYDYADESSVKPQRISKPGINPDARHAFALSYNAANQVTDIVESGWSPTANSGFEAIKRHTQLDYDAGLLTRIDGPRDDVADITALTYDQKQRLRTFTTPDGRTLRITAYDDYGRPTEIRQGKQQPVIMAYNQRGDVTRVTRRGQTLHYHYDAAGHLTQVTGPDRDGLKVTYDAAGRATEMLGPNGRRIISELDSEGRTTSNQLLTEHGEVLAQLSYFYDAEGRLNKVQRNSEAARTMEYDDSNKLTSVSDAQGNTTGFEYSSLGELLVITQPDGNATRLAYDARQNVNAVTDARNNQTQYQYNDFGQLIAQHSPDTGTTRYAYDSAGNQIDKTSAAGNIAQYSYDAANRVTQSRYTDHTIRYQYDAITGRLSKVDNASTTETFAYNRDAQLIEHTRTIDELNFTTAYAYTKQGKLARKELPDGQLLKYHYHEGGPQKGTLRAITRNNLIGQTTIIGELNSNDTATQTRWQHGNGVAVNKQIDDRGKPVAYSFNKALTLSYTYDKVGQITGIARNGKSNWYKYDVAGQLIGADTSLGRFEYGYDEVGNRTRKAYTQNGRTEQTNYEFAASGAGNRLLNINGKARNYNAQGSPTKTEKLRYEYNAQQRPVKVYKKDSNTLIAEYAYNSFGARIKKIAHSSNSKKHKTITYYLYDGRKLTAEANEKGKVTAQYVYYRGQPVAKLQRRDVYAIHADHLGTPLNVTDARQKVVWHAEYTPFGEAAIEKETVTLNIRFPGQYFDEETGMHYNYFRDYDPETGRYLTSDPIGLKGGINSYAYVQGNPLSYGDPLGLFTLQDARNQLAADNIEPTGPYVGSGQYAESVREYSNDQIFQAWFDLEDDNREWMNELKDRQCPLTLELDTKKYPDGRGGCIAVTRALNPHGPNNADGKWVDPHNGPSLQVFHPGGTWEMRSVPTQGGYTSQCIYNANGNIMRDFSSRFGTAGTADFNGGVDGSHWEDDVKPFFMAQLLGRVPEYYRVRPMNIEGDP